MCDAAMCENIVGYYKRGPLYFITSQQSSLFFCSIAVRHSRTSRTPFCPHEGLLSFNLHFPLLCPPLRNWFPCSSSCKGGLVCSQLRCKVSCDSCDVAVNAILLRSKGPRSSFTIDNVCKPVQGKTIVTCCKITGMA